MKVKVNQQFITGAVVGVVLAYVLLKNRNAAPIKDTDTPKMPRVGKGRVGIRPWDTPWSQARALHA